VNPAIRRKAIRYARQAGVPPRLYLELVRAESGGNPNAYNPSGATGLVQIHLPSHPNVTRAQAQNPDFALPWGAKYLKEQYKKFGSWKLALAAYNAGPGAVAKYNGVPPYAETQNYVSRILTRSARAGGLRPQPAAPAVPRVRTVRDAGRPAGLEEQVIKTGLKPEAFGAINNIYGMIGMKPLPETLLQQTALVQTNAGMPTAPGQTGPAIPRRRRPGAAGTVPRGGKVAPLATPMGQGSEFGYVDAEGAPSRRTGKRHHAGKDWFAPAGSEVVAPWNGKVVEVKASRGNSGQVFGGVVKIQAPNGRVFVARHVDPRGVRIGQRVRAGRPIAAVSPWTGGSPHAHIEIWKTLRGGYSYENMIDPVRVFRQGR
jgi:murein DD-endopeptidase MepM/ murein hydrolase activator NlpD